MENILSYSAVELGAAIKAGKTTAVEAMEAVLESIGKKEKEINAYVTVDKERALEKAAQTQKKIEQGELTGALAGVPAAIKDNMCTAGMLTTCSSKILGNFVPTYTAEAVLNLENAGAVDYVITPNAEDNIALIDNGNGSYEFNFNGKDGEIADTARPTARIHPVTIPSMEDGSTTVRIICHFPLPRPSAPSR